ncbi:MAG: 3-dehydroquinate dehydratase, partial [Rhodocyclales bacterium]|nr:3-dehydroquinate dehydratase [Rhodocyclales bacterium]
MSRQTRSQKATSQQLEPRILVLHGPNLNLLGTREPGIYGRNSLAEVHLAMEAQGRAAGVQVESVQSTSEGDLIDRIQS